MDSRNVSYFLAVSVILFIGQIDVSSANGWKEETDWGQLYVRGGHHTRRGPHLLPGLPTNVSVTAGMLATLPCRVANLKGRAVSWIRKEDLKVLATDGVTFTSDQRMKVRAWRTGVVWALDLQIQDTSLRDAGVYECQVNTRPKLSHPITLYVNEGGASIPGPSEIYLETGSRLKLTCEVILPPLHPGSILWLRGDSPINTADNKNETDLQMRQEGRTTFSTLTLHRVSSEDAGNYTCLPENLEPAAVVVYVLKDELPRAMYHDSCPETAGPRREVLLLLSLTAVVFR